MSGGTWPSVATVPFRSSTRCAISSRPRPGISTRITCRLGTERGRRPRGYSPQRDPEVGAPQLSPPLFAAKDERIRSAFAAPHSGQAAAVATLHTGTNISKDFPHSRQRYR